LGFCATFNGIVSRARLTLKVHRHRSCHCPHLRRRRRYLPPDIPGHGQPGPTARPGPGPKIPGWAGLNLHLGPGSGLIS
jgi:hypothetical protein